MYMLDFYIYMIVMIKEKLIYKSVSLVFHSLRVKRLNLVLVWLSYIYYWFLVTTCKNIFLVGQQLVRCNLLVLCNMPALSFHAGRATQAGAVTLQSVGFDCEDSPFRRGWPSPIQAAHDWIILYSHVLRIKKRKQSRKRGCWLPWNWKTKWTRCDNLRSWAFEI